jgi:NADPH:quinone reductase-like Zn-dependent oxidoreductase
MNAIRVHRSGGPEVPAFEQTPPPAPSGSDALIRVRATGVGPRDAPVRVERIAVVNGGSLKPGAIHGVTNAKEASSLLCPCMKL